MTDELEMCLQLYRSRSDFYEKIDLNIAAVHHDKSWYNIRAKILPLAQEASIVSERLIDVEDFVIIHERLDTDRFAELLRNISSDNLEISGLTINFFANQHVPSLRVHDYCQGDSLRAKQRWDIEWPVDLYEWEKSHKLHNELDVIFREIDMKLRCFNPPYKDVEDAVVNLLNLPKYHFKEYQSKDSKCSILLPNFVAIEQAKLHGNEFEVTARFHKSISLEELILSVVGYGRKTIRFREDLQGGKIETSPPFVRISK